MPQGFCRESSWVYKVAHEYDVENECRATWNGVSRCFLRSRSGAAAACNEGGGKHLRTVGGSHRQDPAAERNGGAAVLEIGRASCREECRSRWSPYHLKKKKKKLYARQNRREIEVVK